MTKIRNEGDLVFSYLALRKAIGILGIALPFALALGAWLIFQTGLQSSISSYYYTGVGAVFVGTLWAIGFFLFSYRGYERADDIAGTLAWVFALGVSLFPTSPADPSARAKLIGDIHLAFAALLFGTLTYFSLCLFTRTDPSKRPTRKKLQRNWVYRVCGYVMAACILLIGIYFLVKGDTSPMKGYNVVFWLEAITIEAFGISWLIKGEAILQD